MTGAREDGFTLVELIVSISIGAIIIAGLAQALTIGLRTTAATATTLVDAGDARALAARLHADVKGADLLGGEATAAPACDPPAPASTLVLWTRAAGATAAYFVTRVAADAASGTPAHSRLSRRTCPGGSPLGFARWSGVAAAPRVLCDGRPQCGGERPLQEPLTAAATQIRLPADATELPDVGPDAPAYEVTVGSGAAAERMTVRAVARDADATTLTVTRPAGIAHPMIAPGPAAEPVAVRYKPAIVDVRVPRPDSADCDDPGACDADDDVRLTIMTAST